VTRRNKEERSFEIQATKVSGETNIIFANELFEGFRVGFRRDQRLSSLHLDNNDKRFKV